MKIAREQWSDFLKHNESYNSAVGPLVGEIFQTYDKSPIGYVMARNHNSPTYNFRQDRNLYVVNEAYTPPQHQETRFDLSGLGEYERVIFSCLAWGQYSTYVLTGEMGSGKTTTTNLIREVLERRRFKFCGICEKCDPIIISLDFNQGFRGKRTDDLLRRFQKTLYSSLRSNLRKVFILNNMADALLEEIASGEAGTKYAGYDSFAQEQEEDISAWNAKSAREKANSVFKFVDERTQSDEERIELMMCLVHLTKKRLRADPACLVFFFDNIDSIWPEAQYEILVEILSYMGIAEAKALVILRKSTFARLQNQAAFSFGCIEHRGPDVTEIIKRRIQYYYDNLEGMQTAKVLEPRHSKAVKQRLGYLLKTAKEPHGALQEIANLAGVSARLGLYISERLIVNTGVAYDIDPPHFNDLSRAVLWGIGNTPGIFPDDPCIANLFLNRVTGFASLLNIRILQLVAALENEVSKTNVLTLLVLLRHIGNWRSEEVRRALNYLLYMRRPLLWIDGKAEYESVASMQNSDDLLHLTEAGRTYLQQLTRDVVYVQEATLSVDWSNNWIPSSIDYSSTVDRFKVLRGALRALLEEDLSQTRLFKRRLTEGKIDFSPNIVLIINRVIAGVGLATLRILGGFSGPQIPEELRDWLSLINVGLKYEREINSSCRSLDKLSRDYNNYLGSLAGRKLK